MRPRYKIMIALLVLPVFLVALGTVYQQVMLRQDARQYPPLGAMVDVGGYRMHIHCTGDAQPNQPTVILASGGGAYSSMWYRVQPEVATFARVCSYDRAGLGWSEPGPTPRTAAQQVTELHTLLMKAAVTPPYILVGHSAGGGNMHLYASRYPEQVAGLVLVDAVHERQWDYLPAELQAQIASGNTSLRVMEATARVGLLRLALQTDLVPAPPPFADMPDDLRAAALSREVRAGTLRTKRLEGEMAIAGLDAMRDEITLPNVPLTVIARGQAMFGPGLDEQTATAAEQGWREMQEAITAEVNNARFIVAENSGHNIMIDQPRRVIEPIRAMLASL